MTDQRLQEALDAEEVRCEVCGKMLERRLLRSIAKEAFAADIVLMWALRDCGDSAQERLDALFCEPGKGHRVSPLADLALRRLERQEQHKRGGHEDEPSGDCEWCVAPGTVCGLCRQPIEPGGVYIFGVCQSPWARDRGAPPDTHGGCAADEAWDRYKEARGEQEHEAEAPEPDEPPELEPMAAPDDGWLEQEPQG